MKRPGRPGEREDLESRLGEWVEALESARATFLNAFKESAGAVLKIARALREADAAALPGIAEAVRDVERALEGDRLRGPLDRLLGCLRDALSGRRSPAGRARRVALLVEDDELLRLVVERVLLREGFEVEAFGGPEAALAEGEGPYDLAIADIRIPSVRGKAFVRYLRRRPGQEGTPVLFLAVPEEGPGAPWGADAVLYKPFTPQEFLDAVRRLIRRPTPK
ncbi:MAG TPA: response regulator [Planctomycetota bacterium]|jgi:CheY-like chemotaxis protein|nr:response regulator [Planctomycetota bacterium]